MSNGETKLSGALQSSKPQPSPSTQSVTSSDWCRECNGTGTLATWEYTGHGYEQKRVYGPCHVCNGTGSRYHITRK